MGDDRLSGVRLEMASAGSAWTFEPPSEGSISPQRTAAAVASNELPASVDWLDANSSDSDVSLSGSVSVSESTEGVPAWWDWNDASSEQESDSDQREWQSSRTGALQSTAIADLPLGSWGTATFNPARNAQPQVATQSPELTSRSVGLATVGAAEPPRAGNAALKKLRSRATKRPRSCRSDSHV